ncbi:hypothetical protein BKA61DRAFT_590008 [Leptodontidium sp. MPI-SDFR-AT-0119]|nr:hypothetical protein BKA61DRAFT_590008 [Leptodontidium sp. MPI-SDFR-AT-0119]
MYALDLLFTMILCAPGLDLLPSLRSGVYLEMPDTNSSLVDRVGRLDSFGNIVLYSTFVFPLCPIFPSSLFVFSCPDIFLSYPSMNESISCPIN